MKRKLMIIGITILLVLSSVITSYAVTETTVTVTPSNEQVKVGETFSVILSANCPDGIGTLETQYSYDKEKLELKSEEVINSSFFNLNLDNGQIMQEGLISVMGTVNEGDIYKITFKVKENVEKNTTIKVTFTKTVIGAWNTDAEYKLPAKEVILTVVEAQCEHTYGKDVSNNNGTHSATCSKCNDKRTGNCTYQDGKCSVCGYVQPTTGGENKPCEHTYGKDVSNNNGTHSATCSKCNDKRTGNCTYQDGKCSVCGYVQPTTGGENKSCEHTYGRDASNNNGTHSATCSKCNDKRTGNCTYQDGQCSVCGYVQPTTGGDNKPCDHSYGEYKDNGNGKHSNTCVKCGYKLEEDHKFYNGECKYCNAKEPKDNTTADKEIPKAGLSTMLAISIVAIVIIAVVMFRKNQKYKDIK